MMLARGAVRPLAASRKCVSAGEALPRRRARLWQEATGIEIIDGIGATEMLHIFISPRTRRIRAGATGRPCPATGRCVVDDGERRCRPARSARLAVQGPTGCRYLADERQATTCKDGWNSPATPTWSTRTATSGYQARTDDMIISAGYNIAGPEVEERAARASRGRRVRRGRRARRGARADRQGVRRAAARASTRPTPLRKELQDFVKQRDRAVQVPARDRVRRRAAAHRDRQAAALPAAPDGAERAAARTPERMRSCSRPAGRVRAATPTASRAEGRLVFVAGQIGWDARGTIRVATTSSAQVAAGARRTSSPCCARPAPGPSTSCA